MIDDAYLAADCSRCAALCCVALAFDASSQFPFDKAAGEPCRNLDVCGLCKIHDDLKSKGYGGCISFHCHGAGPRTTRDLFEGVSWQSDRALLSEMMEGFWIFAAPSRDAGFTG